MKIHVRLAVALSLTVAVILLSTNYANADTGPTPAPSPSGPFGTTSHHYTSKGISGHVNEQPTGGIHPDHPVGSVGGASTFGKASLWFSGFYIEGDADTQVNGSASQTFTVCAQVLAFNAAGSTYNNCRGITNYGTTHVATSANWVICPPQPTTISTKHEVDLWGGTSWVGYDYLSQHTCP